MPLSRVIIKNYKSIKHCDVTLSELNVLIGENGTGKTNLLEAINYFYNNLTDNNVHTDIFDENNRYSNEVRITLVYDFTEILKITKSNTDEMKFFDRAEEGISDKFWPYYQKIIKLATEAKDKKIKVELSQIKGKSIQWNYGYPKRFVFKSLFPVFFINTRNLDVTEWERIWDALGELGKISNQGRKKVEKDLKDLLKNGNSEIGKNIRNISTVFSQSDASIKEATTKDFAKTLVKLYLSGDTIQNSGRRLGYFSAGTNSVKYIELLLKIINIIAVTKLKEPIVLFDEPEIGLHTCFLDELSDIMTTDDKKLHLVVSTHSSRLVKNLIIKSLWLTLFSVKLVDGYSNIRRMRKFSQYSPESKYRVADDHINAYFSRAILFVEGETELELFANPYLKLLFPALTQVDVFKAMTQKPVLNVMNPGKNRIDTPYLCLIDLDKALAHDREHNKLNLQKEFIGDKKTEKYFFRNRQETETYLYHQRKHIEAMAKALRVHYFLPYYSCKDENFKTLVKAIHEYLLGYHVFTLETTIEGSLINKRTEAFALAFLQKKKKAQAFNKYKTYWDTLAATDKINSLRLVYNGKSDLMFGKIKDLRKPEQDYISESSIGSKTCGWVSEYIDDYFSGWFVDDIDHTEKKFQQLLTDQKKKKEIIKRFKYDFPELNDLMEQITNMVTE